MKNLKRHIKSIIKEYLNEKRGIIKEAITDIVYHFLPITELYRVLKTNKLHAIAAIGTDADFNINRGKPFFFATTRSRSAGYTFGSAKLVLDGRKLNYLYKGAALDYWSDKTFSARNPKNNKTEFEDRLVLDKPEIPNAVKYILEIHVNKDKDSLTGTLREIVNMANAYNIPIYFYESRADYLNQNTKKAYKPDFKDTGEVDEELSLRDYHIYPLLSFAAHKNEDNLNKILKYLDEDQIKRFMRQREEDERYNLNFGRYLYSGKDLIRELKNSVHTLREDSGELVRFALTMIVNEMKKMGVKNFEEYIDKKMWIGRKKYKWYNQKMIDDTIETMRKNFNESLQSELNYGTYYTYIMFDDEEYPNIFKVPSIISYLNRLIQSFEKEIKRIIGEEKEIFYYSFKIGNGLEKIYNFDKEVIENVFNKIENENDEERVNNAKYSLNHFIENIIRTTSNEAYDLVKKYGDEYRINLED